MFQWVGANPVHSVIHPSLDHVLLTSLEKLQNNGL